MFFVFAIIFAPLAENRLVAFSSRIDTRKLSDPFPPKAPTYDVEVCDEPKEYRTLFHTSRCWTTSSDSLLLIDWLILITSTGRKFVGVLYIAASRWIHSGANGCQSYCCRTRLLRTICISNTLRKVSINGFQTLIDSQPTFAMQAGPSYEIPAQSPLRPVGLEVGTEVWMRFSQERSQEYVSHNMVDI